MELYSGMTNGVVYRTIEPSYDEPLFQLSLTLHKVEARKDKCVPSISLWASSGMANGDDNEMNCPGRFQMK